MATVEAGLSPPSVLPLNPLPFDLSLRPRSEQHQRNPHVRCGVQRPSSDRPFGSSFFPSTNGDSDSGTSGAKAAEV